MGVAVSETESESGSTGSTTSDEEVGSTAVYARVSTGFQSESQDDQIERLTTEYPSADVFADVGSGDDPDREDYVEMREELEAGTYDRVAATKLDRLGRSTAEVAELIDLCSERDIGIHLITQGVNADPDDEIGQAMMKMMGVFAEMELNLARERRREGIERALDQGVQFGRAPHGMTKNEMGVPVPGEGYERVQAFIREVKKGRPKRPTARFFEVPEGSIATILERAGELYGIEFDNDEWTLERAKVEAGEKKLSDLGEK